MSRSGYSDDLDTWDMIRWRGQVASAIRGQRGQQLLRELAEAMDAMPDKRLIANELECEGSYCALGVVGHARGIDMRSIDPEDSEEVASVFNIARQLAKEIVFINDEAGYWQETPERRWARVRQWVDSKIKEPATT